MSKIRDLVNEYLKANPALTGALRTNSEEGLIRAVEGAGYVVRNDQFVNPRTNLVLDSAAIITQHARSFLKPLGSGRYLPRFRDERSEQDQGTMAKATREVLKTWIERKGYVFIADEPLRVWLDSISKSMVYESDGNGSFRLAVLVNGVPVKKYSPDELLPGIGSYIDQDKTELAQLRIAARLREEALKLSGLQLSDLNDERKKAYFEGLKGKVEKEYYAQPTQKKLPEVPTDLLLDDLQKEAAYTMNLPIEPAAWTLQERTKVRAIAENHIAEESAKALESIQKYESMRPASFFRDEVREVYSGLPYIEKASE